MKNQEVTNLELKELANFLKSTDLENLSKLTDNSDNFFKILKLENLEIRHSNFLVWVMEQNNHEFLKKLLSLIDTKYEDFDFSDIKIMREYKHIDILIVSEKNNFVCAIENKIYSSEHGKQLDNYEKVIAEDYPEYAPEFVYLTIKGEYSSNEKYKPLSYQQILYILNNDKISDNNKIQLLINDYISILQNDILGYPDEKTFDICKKLTSNYGLILAELQDKTTEQIRRKYDDEIAYLYDKNINAINKIFFCQNQIKAVRDNKVNKILNKMIQDTNCIQLHGSWANVINLSSKYPMKMIDYTALPFDNYSIKFHCGLTVDKSRKIVELLVDDKKNILANCKNLPKNWNYKIGLWIKLNRVAQPMDEALYFAKQDEYIGYLKKHDIVGVQKIIDTKNILQQISKISDINEFQQLSEKINSKDYKELTLLPCLYLNYTFKDLDINDNNEDEIVKMYRKKTLEGLKVFGLDKEFEKGYLKPISNT